MRMNHDQTHEIHPIQRLRALLVDYDFEFSELLNGLAATLWGLWLLLPWNTFGRTATFAAMRDTGVPEWLWGTVIFTLGIIQIAGLVAGWWRWRRRSALILCGVWAFIAVMFAQANISSTGTVIYPLFSLSAMWAYLRMRFV